MSARTPVVLTIAGSDSGGGAGIQADLKAFASQGVHGTSAITAITAQNTLGVDAVHSLPPQIVLAQVRSVLSDLAPAAVKVGMLGSEQVTRAVAAALDELPAGTPVVVDPVMVAESGARLLEPGAQLALVEEILPRASVLTPNLLEACALLGEDPQTVESVEDEQAGELASGVLALGPAAVVLTGGHRTHATDVLVRRGVAGAVVIEGPRHAEGAAHGSGCTHSSVLAARLAFGDDLEQAARAARHAAGEAVMRGLRELGAGAGPVDAIGLRAVRERSADRRKL